MQNKRFPWKNLTSQKNSTEKPEVIKMALMTILQNYALFSIDPSEVMDVGFPPLCFYFYDLLFQISSHLAWNLATRKTANPFRPFSLILLNNSIEPSIYPWCLRYNTRTIIFVQLKANGTMQYICIFRIYIKYIMIF